MNNNLDNVKDIIKSINPLNLISDSVEITSDIAAVNPVVIVKILKKSIEFYGNASNIIFYNKLRMFFENIEDISDRERILFLNKYVGKDNNEFERKLLEEINAISDSKKIEFVSNTFKSLVYDKIDLDMFDRLIDVIKKTLFQDLMYLKDNVDNKDLGANVHTIALNNVGLMFLSNINEVEEYGNRYSFLNLANILNTYSLNWEGFRAEAISNNDSTQAHVNTSVNVTSRFA